MKCEKCRSEWTSRQSITKCPFCGEPIIESKELETMPEILKHIVDSYGVEVMLNTNRLISLASDFAPDLTKERRLLKVCGESGIIKEMVDSTDMDAPSKEALINKSIQKLESSYMIGEEWAKLGIGFVAFALGWSVASEKIESGEVTDYRIDGGMYTGNLEGGSPSGTGRFVFDGGHVYEGEFKDGKFHGKGKISWNHGNRKLPCWNDFWNGEWKNGEPWDGCGTYVFGNYEKVTTIPFDSGLQDGLGVVNYNSGKKYAGSMKNGKFHGLNCSLTESDGRVFTGEFKEDKLFCGFEFDNVNNLIAYYNSGIKKTV